MWQINRSLKSHSFGFVNPNTQYSSSKEWEALHCLLVKCSCWLNHFCFSRPHTTVCLRISDPSCGRCRHGKWIVPRRGETSFWLEKTRNQLDVYSKRFGPTVKMKLIIYLFFHMIAMHQAELIRETCPCLRVFPSPSASRAEHRSSKTSQTSSSWQQWNMWWLYIKKFLLIK